MLNGQFARSDRMQSGLAQIEQNGLANAYSQLSNAAEATLTSRLADCARRIANTTADIQAVHGRIFGHEPENACTSQELPPSGLADYVSQIEAFCAEMQSAVQRLTGI